MNCKYENCFRPLKYKAKQVCQTHYNREWASENPEKARELKKKYYENNKDKVKASSYKWRKANPETSRKYGRLYMAKNSKNPVTQEHMTDSVKERFFAKVDKTDTCWNWVGARSAYRPKRKIADATPGYGVLNINGRVFYAHRASWLMHNGPLIPGLVIDHLCNNTLCVNPDHLQQVTNNENTQRSPKHTANGAKYRHYKTHCKYGHVRTEDMRNKPCVDCYEERKANKRMNNA